MNAATEELHQFLDYLDSPIVRRTRTFGARDTFRPDSREVARRALYLAWAYQTAWEEYPLARQSQTHLAELGMIILEIIGADMRDLYDAAVDDTPPPTRGKAEHPHFESAEDVKRAFDLLQAEKAAGGTSTGSAAITSTYRS